jgi:hypothetical protein
VTRAERAIELFLGGCNCAQAVFAAFADLFGMERSLALRLSSSEQGQVTNQATESCSRTCPIKQASAFFAKHKKVAITVVRCTVLAIGVLFVLLGILNGGMNDVVQKAIKICTECIGLG